LNALTRLQVVELHHHEDWNDDVHVFERLEAERIVDENARVEHQDETFVSGCDWGSHLDSIFAE
jgi:hypothetical protein